MTKFVDKTSIERLKNRPSLHQFAEQCYLIFVVSEEHKAVHTHTHTQHQSSRQNLYLIRTPSPSPLSPSPISPSPSSFPHPSFPYAYDGKYRAGSLCPACNIFLHDLAKAFNDICSVPVSRVASVYKNAMSRRDIFGSAFSRTSQYSSKQIQLSPLWSTLSKASNILSRRLSKYKQTQTHTHTQQQQIRINEGNGDDSNVLW